MLPLQYIPKSLTPQDQLKQLENIKKSSKLYKQGKYLNRPKLSSFESKPSSHIQKAKELYNVNSIKPSKELSKKTGCSLDTLNKIVEKGKGAYYSSGSRPNQTPFSWGIARLASAITGGNSSKIDLHLLQQGCLKRSIALQLAKKN